MYHQLTWEQRSQIFALLQKKIKRKEIALIVGTREATISRELKNNSTPSGKYIRTKAHDGIIFVYPLDKTLLCGIPCLVLSWDERRERGENHMVEDLDGAFLWLCLFLPQLVALGIAHR